MKVEEKLKEIANLSTEEWYELLSIPEICTRCTNHYKIKDECKLDCQGYSCCKKGITEYLTSKLKDTE